MPKYIFETATNIYTSQGSIGDGGCGTVHRVIDPDGDVYALKLLRETNTAKRKRFQNELSFCRRNQHERILRVIDDGIFSSSGKSLPFYVMPLYASTLRKAMDAGIPHERVLRVFADILDGVEAAHLQGVIHRDLKPENFLVDANGRLVVADFGIARFREEDLHTLVETKAGEKLANYRYSAPEQRATGQTVDVRADIFALGLILAEMFTGEVPQGLGHTRIDSVSPEHAYLDGLVDAMIQHSPNNRPSTVSKVKEELIGRGNEFIAKQRLDAARRIVVSEAVPNDPLGGQGIRAMGASYSDGVLTIELSATPPPEWVTAMNNPRFGYQNVMGDSDPRTVQFRGNSAILRAKPSTVATTAGNFKQWVGQVNLGYLDLLKQKAAEMRRREQERMKRAVEKAEEEAKAAESLRSVQF